VPETHAIGARGATTAAGACVSAASPAPSGTV
jgi:hypothetical protein